MITVFTTTTCSYCKIAKQYLTSIGREFTSVNLDDSPEIRQELIDKTGAMTVPIIQIDDKYIIGWNRKQLAEAL